MIALFNSMRNRSFGSWTRMTTSEGVHVFFPQQATHVCSVAETPFGPMKCSVYSSAWNNNNANSILAIRDYESPTPLQPDDLFLSWKSDFRNAMDVSGVYKHVVDECYTQGKFSRYDLLYANREETAFTRVCLIAQGNRLIVLFTVGMFQDVNGPECKECYRSIRL